MEKNIKIIASPFNSNMEVIDKIVLTLHVPYTDDNVTIKVNPFLQDYHENLDKSGMQIRQFSISTDTKDTKNLLFDFKENNIHKVKTEDKEYEIRLMQIGKENIQGQDFLYFEFYIKW